MTRLIVVAAVAVLITAVTRAEEAPRVFSQGDWSRPVSDRGRAALRGRLVLCEKPRSDNYREVAVYVELQDASTSVGSGMRLYCDLGRTDLRPEYKGGLHCELRDKDGRPVMSTPFAFSGGVPASEWVVLPSDGTIRLRASPFGIRREKALPICPGLDKLWVIGEGDANEYFLLGTFTIDPDAGRAPPVNGHVWRGTIELPAMRIVSKRTK